MFPWVDDHSSKPAVTSQPLAANPDRLGVKPPSRKRREVPIWHCSRWGLPCQSCCQSCGGPDPTVSPLTGHTRPVCSLWRYPWGYPRRALPGTVLCGVRTFLPKICKQTPKRSSSHPREGGVRRSGGLRQWESAAPDQRQGRGRYRQAVRSRPGETADETR